MIVNAMLCDFAEVHGNKLFISGANINLAGTNTTQPPHLINLWIAGTITVPWTQTNQQHHLRVAVEDQDGGRVHLVDPMPGIEVSEDDRGAHFGEFNVGRAPIMQTGEESLVPFAFPLSTGLPHLGPFVVTVSVDGTELARMGFRLIAPQPGMQFQM